MSQSFDSHYWSIIEWRHEYMDQKTDGRNTSDKTNNDIGLRTVHPWVIQKHFIYLPPSFTGTGIGLENWWYGITWNHLQVGFYRVELAPKWESGGLDPPSQVLRPIRSRFSLYMMQLSLYLILVISTVSDFVFIVHLWTTIPGWCTLLYSVTISLRDSVRSQSQKTGSEISGVRNVEIHRYTGRCVGHFYHLSDGT